MRHMIIPQESFGGVFERYLRILETSGRVSLGERLAYFNKYILEFWGLNIVQIDMGSVAGVPAYGIQGCGFDSQLGSTFVCL